MVKVSKGKRPTSTRVLMATGREPAPYSDGLDLQGGKAEPEFSLRRGAQMAATTGFVVVEGVRRKVHVVKSWPEFFKPVASGHKRAELRRDDRGYQAGDHVIFQEFDPIDIAGDGRHEGRGYTGMEVRCEITHVMRRPPATAICGESSPDPLCHIPEGWCILSIELAGAPSVLVRALDRLCTAAEFVLPGVQGENAPKNFAAAIKDGRDALGVVDRK